MEKILVTGFGPFGHNTSNPSSNSLETLGCGDDNIIICPNIEVSCKAVDDYMSSIDATNMRIHLGLNEKAKTFKIEQFAYNEKNFPIPDISGLGAAGEAIDVNGPIQQETNMDVHALLSHLVKMEFQVEISDDPGRYLCNYMYYKSLNKNRNAIFVHVPPYEVIDKSIQKHFITCLINYMSGGIKKVSGIANLGNTCYMNAAIQCGIIACAPLVRHIEAMNVSDSQSLTKAIAWLLNEIHNPDNRNAIYPNMVKNKIDEKIQRFKGTDQHDCFEFLIEIFEALHTELNIGIQQDVGMNTGPGRMVTRSAASTSGMLTRSTSSLAALNGTVSGKSFSSINWRSRGEQWWTGMRKKDNSIIKQLFEGAIRSVMTCYKCGGISARFEPFTSLILPLTPDSINQSISDLIHDMLRPEELDGIECDYCKRKQTFHRQIDLWKSPPFLILTISRFSFDYRAVARKLTNFVNYPHELSLDSLIAKEAPLQEYADKYELYAVVEHEGTVNRGHYTAMVKVDGRWMAINDARINNSVDDLRAITNNAYMLFYKWSVIDDPNAMFDLEEYLESSF